MNLQTSCVQLVRADRHCQPPEQHFRVQGLQEQNPDISGKHMETTLSFSKCQHGLDSSFSGEASLCRQAALPGVDVDEHCSKAHGRVIFL